ncbi:MAG: DNA mismatch repair endonuclease MutL [Thermodesulfobacteriota bacterium]|nr:DNA mismatch repair endonuclease MutL [Thermodesulfobacteriota bacterium]
MSKIKILPENWANQIAAGEVVERPASVVKEFVENSIDAHAANITVEIQGGGTRLIRVIDDGMGMDADDVLLCLERHATSKLVKLEQLGRIASLGFRGEAVPSIASISRMTILSRQADQELGTRAEIAFGRLNKVHETGCARGTVFEVRDLFGNVPARKKFLKSVRTELFHIEEVVKNYSLACPELGFIYSVANREILRLSAGSDSLEVRVKRLLAPRVRGDLVAIDSGLQDHLRVSGFLLPPDESVGTAAKFRLFVNGRAVRDRMVMHAVAEGLHGFLLKGHRPAGALFLDLDPGMVDVNVHPAKQEIRFHRANVIHQHVVLAVRDGIKKAQEGIKHRVFGAPALPPTPSKPARAGEPVNPWSPPVSDSLTGLDGSGHFSSSQKAKLSAQTRESSGVFALSSSRESSQKKKESQPDAVNNQKTSTTSMLPGVQFPGLRYVGQIFKSYLLCESDEGLVAIDQHAAHERLLFEKLNKQYQANQLASQSLLFPEVVECSSARIRILKQFGADIAALGLEIQEFGGESYVVKAIPAILGHLSPSEILGGIFDIFGDEAAGGQVTRAENVLSTMACKGAIKANHALLPEEGRELVNQMCEADIFSHCPHGRPVVKLFSPNEVKKWFHRS